jgi:predicted acyltransferase
MPRTTVVAPPRSSQGPARVATTSPGTTARLQSLDVFRGITIAAMLLVNNPGSWSHVYAPLQHAAWHGSTPTDLVFPFFLFIVGITTTYSLGGMMDRGVPRCALLRKALVRAVIIFALGLTLQGFPHYDLPHLRLLGVLQRIALSYLVAAAIVLFTPIRGQAAALSVLLVGYWVLLVGVPVPGVGRGILEPDLNLANWIDLHVIGTNHLPGTWDPEGILSTLGAIATVLCGVLAGHWIRSTREAAPKVVRLMLAGGTGIVIGLLWSQLFPINKSLWTGSYVAFTAGIASVILAGLYWLVDVRGERRWAWPFLVFGTNAITAYWVSSLVAIVLDWIVIAGPGEGEARVLKTYLYDMLLASWLPPVSASLAYAIVYVLLWLGLLGVLYRRRILIRI